MKVKDLIARLKQTPPLAEINVTLEDPATGVVYNAGLSEVEYIPKGSIVRLFSE